MSPPSWPDAGYVIERDVVNPGPRQQVDVVVQLTEQAALAGSRAR